MQGKERYLDNKALTTELSGIIGRVVPGKSVLLYGSPMVYYAALIVIKEILRKLPSVTVVDGANRYDAYELARLARLSGMDPFEVLNRVFVSRIFTAFQADGVITRGVGPFLNESKAKVLIVLGLLHTFYDDQISVREAEKSLARISAKFDVLKKSGVSLLLASESLTPSQRERQAFQLRLKAMVDDVYEVSPDSSPLVHSGNVVWNKNRRLIQR
ncbi:MAG: hypothetical protein WAO19_03175 [Candidatus Kryptoniota bacterium]